MSTARNNRFYREKGHPKKTPARKHSKTLSQNMYKCPVRLWGKMSDKQRIAYNALRSISSDLICPPNLAISKNHFDVISHNFSYLGATYLVEINS